MNISSKKVVERLKEIQEGKSTLQEYIDFLSAKPGDDPRFDEFYAAYPKKQAKPAAQRSWKALRVNDELFAAIMAALAIHKQTPTWQKENGIYVPMPSTWLNQRRWEDQLKVKVEGKETNSRFDNL